MNSQISKKMLIDTAETMAKVSPELHQNIMRAVRLATPHGKKTPLRWTVPAWGAGVAVLAVVIFQLAQTATVTPAQPATLAQTQKSAGLASLVLLGDKLAAFSGQTRLPEKELMAELERLKSDLERFGLKS